ncbi:hypothetical protein J4N45_11045 [Vibrio sp. SCSIO 43140]|uniref:hypothetical protein n=1 Tax=Vibrio sp. SCSIO 43140 TaxID=2819100 RepID=UPI00207595C7|nr:hypothetical protein [Vibrio sp. SCSIO 43140]USD59067.1 hypothetical protein J4N45_11045 [Vibrio sp. SCSIO 43140]
MELATEKQCKHCFSQIHIDASRCNHCRSWQSKTGLVPRTSEILALCMFCLLCFAIGGAIAVNKLNDFARDKLSQYDQSVVTIVLSEFPDYRENGSVMFSLNNINIINADKAIGIAERISDEVSELNLSDIQSCVFLKQEKCENLVVQVSNESIMVTKPHNAKDYAVKYITNELRQGLGRGYSQLIASDEGWKVYISE